MKVALVVVTYRSARVLPDLVASLDAACAGLDASVVFVDNASDDGSAALARELAPEATVVELSDNRGYAAGINAGLARVAGAEAVVVANPDLVFRPGSVAALVRALDAPGTGIAAPMIVGPDGSLTHSLRRDPTVARALGEALLGGRRAARYARFGEVVVDGAAYERPGRADWASGAVLCVSRACLDAVGGFDESFFLYSEEVDFALRAREAGFALQYVPEAVAVHHEGESHHSAELWSLLETNRVRLFARRHGKLATLSFRAALALGEGLRALPGEPTHRKAFRDLVRFQRHPPERPV